MKFSEAEAALKARVVERYHEEEERLQQQVGREQLDTTSQDSTATVTDDWDLCMNSNDRSRFGSDNPS